MSHSNPRPAPVRQAIEHAAEEFGVFSGEIDVVDVEQVDWPDTSLGVPEPDRVYAQQIVPGFSVTLQISEQQAIYHTDMTERVVRAH